jgi:hypothetical protein
MGLSINAAIEGAQSKAAGIFPVDLARVLCSTTQADWELVRWIEPPSSAPKNLTFHGFDVSSAERFTFHVRG